MKKSFFGYMNPVLPDSPIQTDCGGMIITQHSLTYRQADAILEKVDSQDFLEYLRSFRHTNHFKNDTCYFHERPSPLNSSAELIDNYQEDNLFRGIAAAATFRYIKDRKLIAIDDNQDYDNSLEYLFYRMLNKLVFEGHISCRIGKFGSMYYDLHIRKQNQPEKEAVCEHHPYDIPIVHLCSKTKTIKPYSRLLCSNCRFNEGVDYSTREIVEELNALRKAAANAMRPAPLLTDKEIAAKQAKDLAWLDFELQFSPDDGETFDEMLQKRSRIDLMGSIKFLKEEREKTLENAEHREMRHNACAFLEGLLS